MVARRHPREKERLEALRAYDVLDTPQESDFDDLVALAAEICGTPISLVSLVGDDRQWFKAKHGVEVEGTSLESSICAHAILEEGHFEISDTTTDARTVDNPLVTGEVGLRFYAGVPLQTPDGLPIGSLCVLDTRPRELTDSQRNSLRILARQVMTHLELRRQLREGEKQRAAARKSADLLAEVTRHFPMRVVYIDQEWRYTFVNEGFERHFGLGLEDVRGRTVRDVLGDEVFEATRRPLERALSGESHTEELEVPYAGGSRLVRAVYVADRDTEGEVRGVICYTLDVTDQRALESRLLEERNRYHQLLNKAPAFSALLEGPDLVFTYVNDEYLRLVGYRDVLGLPVRQALPEIEGQGYFELLEQVRLTGEPFAGRGLRAFVLSRPDGEPEERFVDLLYQAIFTPQGEPAGVFVHGVDVTEQRAAFDAFRQGEERFRRLVELSPSTVWVAEPDGGLSYISQDFYDMTGLTEALSLPWGWTKVVHPEDLERVATDWEEARRAESVYDTEFRIRHLDGSYRWIVARALPVRDAEGVISGWMGSNSDIQEQKAMEVTLREHVEQRTAELQRSIAEAEGFNYSISHDLRTPLRAISATANILLEEAGPELADSHRELLERQAHNATRLGHLIDELLRLSRLARVAVRREHLNLTGKAKALAADIDTSCAFEIQADLTAEADPDLVRTVLQNLLENAAKFSPAGGTIQFGHRDGAFYVSDQGIGFDIKFAPKVFLPFERLVTEDQYPGTGIGLANVKRIIERHGGRIWVESSPGEGTTFFFTLEPAAS